LLREARSIREKARPIMGGSRDFPHRRRILAS
jgi:hypothetical protein